MIVFEPQADMTNRPAQQKLNVGSIFNLLSLGAKRATLRGEFRQSMDGQMRQAKTKPPRENARRGNTRRIDKVEATRQSLFDAALKVVGENGYAGSSIAKIATRANVAQGTFYSYFDSQQDVFNQLLPFLGNRLLNQIREKLKDCKDPYEREAIGFQAYFEFLRENPEFERILSEASVFTPQGFRDHVENIVSGYMRAFRHSKAKGPLPLAMKRRLR